MTCRDLKKLSTSKRKDCARIVKAFRRNRSNTDKEAIAMQCLQRILPPGGAYLAKSDADEKKQGWLLSIRYIEHRLSREVFRSQNRGNIAKIRRIARLYHRQGINERYILIDIDPGDYVDVGFDEYERDLHIAERAVQTFKNTKKALRNWALVRKYVYNRSVTFDAAEQASQRYDMFAYDRCAEVAEVAHLDVVKSHK